VRCVLVLASGARWETEALEVLGAATGLVVLKRCVDVDDLMAAATTGQAEAAVVSAESRGLDTPAVAHLRRHGVVPVAVLADGAREDTADRLAGIGVRTVLGTDELATLPQVLGALAEQRESAERAAAVTPPDPPGDPAVEGVRTGAAEEELPGGPRRVVAVWGPVGSPGRTTVATALAAALARRGRPTVLVDADPHAAVAQHLGVLDQVSGLLGAVRLAASGTLEGRVTGLCRAITPQLGVMTGLPRADRRREVGVGTVPVVLEQVSEFADVVVDVGWELVADGGHRTDGVWGLEVLESADEVVVVGAADPVGLARLARALVELEDVAGRLPLRVVVNRMRGSLGWAESEVAGMVQGFASTGSVHFLPEDRAAVDRALVAGRSVADDPGSRLAVGVERLLDALHPGTATGADGRAGRTGRPGLRGVRQRRAGTARPR